MDASLESRARFIRVSLNLLMAGWFIIIAFWLGPNMILFHKFTRMVPADFVPVVEKYCVPEVRAIKLYVLAHGKMPATVDDLDPPFKGVHFDGPGIHSLNLGIYNYDAIGMYNHTVEYDFTRGHEGWSVHGAFANGTIPVPPVTLEPNAGAGR